MDYGFLLKKSIAFCLEPYGMVLILLLFGLSFKLLRKEKFSSMGFSSAIALLFLYSYQPFSNFLVQKLEYRYNKFNDSYKVDYIHVLGNGHNDDRFQPTSSRISTSGLARVVEGVVIYRKNPGSKLIFTGYGGESEISTAVMNAELAKSLGVKKEDIILGKQAKDTLEEAHFSKKIITDNKKLALVTSASHMPRAMNLFHYAGLDPIAAPTNFRSRLKNYYYRIFDPSSFEDSQAAIHEYLGISWNYLKSSI